jgi:hypothetical protein
MKEVVAVFIETTPASRLKLLKNGSSLFTE